MSHVTKLNEAMQLDKAGRIDDAVEAYRVALLGMSHHIATMRPSEAKEVLKIKRKQYLERAKLLFSFVSDRASNDSNSDDDDTEPEAPGLANWDDIVGENEVKHRLLMLTQLRADRPELMRDIRPENVLLYGPPGTGKTMLAEALASHTGFAFFRLDCANIMRKYVGDSEKFVIKTFNDAKKAGKSIIFMDEVCSIMDERRDDGNKVDDRVKAVLLTSMTELRKHPLVMLIGATNRPWLLDTGFWRRFAHRILLGMPDADTIKVMYDRALSRDVPAAVVDASRGFSKDDVSTAVNQMRLALVDRMVSASVFFKRDGKYHLTGPGERVEISFTDVPAGCLSRPELTDEIMLEVVRTVVPSVSPAEVARFAAKEREFR